MEPMKAAEVTPDGRIVIDIYREGTEEAGYSMILLTPGGEELDLSILQSVLVGAVEKVEGMQKQNRKVMYTGKWGNLLNVEPSFTN